MKFDGKLMAKARDSLSEIRSANSAEQNRRIMSVYAKCSDIELIDAKLRMQMAQLARLTLSKPANLKEQLEELRDSNLELQAQKAELLTENGFSADYMDEIYSCKKCRDTGIYNNGICSCLMKLYNKELTKNLSTMMLSGDESFDNFNLRYYSNLYDPEFGKSIQEVMSKVLSLCREFADNFPAQYSNFLMQGGTGLGKTYLSACIAKEVAAKGFSVCYCSAAEAVAAFERQKFASTPEEREEADEKVDRILNSDLMILDDLGTEMITSVTISALYTLINTRLINRRPMIISTNCTNDELKRKYSEQICSRLFGEYKKLPFRGTDIRILKRGG